MNKHKRIEFSRDGRCPICHKVFRSEQCPHSFGHVQEVVNRVNSNIDEDVKRLKASQ